jgi:hypothetical protein
MDTDVAAWRGLPILGLFRGKQLAAVAPDEMSIAIAPAIRKFLKHRQLAMSDVDLWELHEAYAVTTLYNRRRMERLDASAIRPHPFRGAGCSPSVVARCSGAGECVVEYTVFDSIEDYRERAARAASQGKLH